MTANLMDSTKNVYRWINQNSLVVGDQRWSANHCFWLVGDVCSIYQAHLVVIQMVYMMLCIRGLFPSSKENCGAVCL